MTWNGIDFSRKTDPKHTPWHRVPRRMSEITRKRVALQRLSIACPRRPNETLWHYCAFLGDKVGMEPAEVDQWLYGALYRKDV